MEVKKQFSVKALQDFDLVKRAVEHNDEKAYGDLMMRYRKSVFHMILKIKNVAYVKTPH